jgi:predicted dehydrogenase
MRCAVIGAGHFGAYHAQKYAKLAGAKLVAVVDADLARAQSVARPLGARAETELARVLPEIEAASVAVPTRAHSTSRAPASRPESTCWSRSRSPRRSSRPTR